MTFDAHHAIHLIPAERITAGLRDLEMGQPGGFSSGGEKCYFPVFINTLVRTKVPSTVLLVFHHPQVSQQKKFHAMQVLRHLLQLVTKVRSHAPSIHIIKCAWHG